MKRITVTSSLAQMNARPRIDGENAEACLVIHDEVTVMVRH